MTRHFGNAAHTFFALTVAAAGLFCGQPNAFAQDKARVEIPFKFSANHQQLPAGTYEVERMSPSFVAFVNTRTGKTQAMVLVRSEGGAAIETRGRLRFQRTGGQNYLTQVWMAGTNLHSEVSVPLSKGHELASALSPATTSFEVATK